ncbi:hypothetical protein [Amycolatopsis viridis]|uniref:Uncharacterized protein n=1 Tax=Amycolatopsis viridis TaxID=185678 RepID=A0ABX0SYJ7_9PSEU|nr:hypothetical protein [Amycolatopsis viridis]NIH81705.1 hypothetical protein [Amycolatopsis viridis]
MTEPFDFFAAADEPPFEPTGALGRVGHFAEQAHQGRLDALEALRRAEAEVSEYLRRQAIARDGEVRAATEGKVHADAPATSARTARNIAPRTGTQRARVLTDIVEHAGATDFEICERVGLLDNSVRPRRAELVEGGYVRDSGRIREHRGSQWVIWEPTPAGIDWYRDHSADAA